MVVFVIVLVLEYLFNQVCLKSLYVATASLWRPDAEITKLMPYLIVAYLVTAFLFAYVYTKGYEAKPSGLAEGLRFGLVIGLFVTIPMSLGTFTTMPLPPKLPLYWFIMGMIEYLIAGGAVGLIYKK